MRLIDKAAQASDIHPEADRPAQAPSPALPLNPYDNGTIMYPFWQTCTAYSPTLDDITGVRAKY